MPTLSSINLPTPKSWEEFEEITLDALKIKWDNPNLQRHGRNGQAQAGIDIFGEDYFSFQIGVQCKKYELALETKTIYKEIENAEKFTPTIEMFYFATSLPTDVKLQKEIRLISKKRKDAGKFGVGILFWNDLVQELARNPEILRKHFPDFIIKSDTEHKSLFSLLDLGYYGTSVKYYSDLLYGDFGKLVQEDPRGIEIIVSIINSTSLVLLKETDQVKINNLSEEYLNYVIPHVTGEKENAEFNWKHADDIAKRLSSFVENIEYSLKGEELIVFQIGKKLARWNEFEFNKKNPDQLISSKVLELIEQLISKLNNGVIPDNIKSAFDYYNSDNETFRDKAINRIYQILRQDLLQAEMFK